MPMIQHQPPMFASTLAVPPVALHKFERDMFMIPARPSQQAHVKGIESLMRSGSSVLENV